jgi:integrase
MVAPISFDITHMPMKTKLASNRATRDRVTRQRVRVAPNLRRDPATGMYYGFKKIGRRRFRHSLGTSDRITANGKLSEWLRHLDAADPTAHDLKLLALLQKFLASRGAKAKHTRENDKSFAQTLRDTFQLGVSVPVRKIRTSDLLAWLNTQAKKREWRHRTFNHFRLWLRQMFDLAVADGIVSESTNPFKPKLIRPKKLQPVARNIPTVKQFAAIITNVRESDYQSRRGEESANFLEFLGSAGVGQAEAAALRWRDINGEKMTFVRQKTGVSFQIPIYGWLSPVIARLRAARTSEDDEGRVFSILEAGRALELACERLAYPRFTQRNLRAMLIKRLYDAGVPIKRIALWQGHRDGGKLIQEIYTEVFCDTDAAAEAADLARVTSAEALKVVA